MYLVVANAYPVNPRGWGPSPDYVLDWRLGSRLEVHVNVQFSPASGLPVVVVDMLPRGRDEVEVQIVPVVPH